MPFSFSSFFLISVHFGVLIVVGSQTKLEIPNQDLAGRLLKQTHLSDLILKIGFLSKPIFRRLL